MDPIRRNPDGTPAPPPRTVVQARPDWLARMKMSEPVRLYLYGVGLVVLVGLQLAGLLTGHWVQYGPWGLGIVLGLIPVTEAVRASVFPLAYVVGLAVGRRGQLPVPTAESDAA